ncbi:hypothetical protein D3C71_1982110 [compost metagenome]
MEYKDGMYVMPTKCLKKIITGIGNAKKEACYEEIKRIYSHSKLLQRVLGMTFIDTGVNKNDDVSDACCLAHAFKIDPTQAAIT